MLAQGSPPKTVCLCHPEGVSSIISPRDFDHTPWWDFWPTLLLSALTGFLTKVFITSHMCLLAGVPMMTRKKKKIPRYQDLKAGPFPGMPFSQPCSRHMPGSRPACSGEAARCPAGTAASRAPPPGPGRPPPPSGRPSGPSALAPAASAAPPPAVSPPRPPPEAPGSLPGPGESEGGSTEVTILESTCLSIHSFVNLASQQICIERLQSARHMNRCSLPSTMPS